MTERAYDPANLTDQDRRAISERLVEDGLLIRADTPTGYALTEKGRAWQEQRRKEAANG